MKDNLKDIQKFTFQSEGLLQIEFFKFSPSDSTEGQSEGNLKDNLKGKVLQGAVHARTSFRQCFRCNVQQFFKILRSNFSQKDILARNLAVKIQKRAVYRNENIA